MASHDSLDPYKRITVQEALQSPYLRQVRREEDEVFTFYLH